MDKQYQIVKEIGKTLEEQVLITNMTIGEGAFSKVYIAFFKKEFFEKKEKASKLCAKILQISNPTQLPYKQIQTEQQIMMSIQSPYVLRLLQFHQTINNELNEGQVLYLFGQLSRGMLELKRQNVFHRDLKPSNILIKDGTIKIADFGLSKICDPLHISNTQVGTPYYMSPQALESKNYNLEKNDIWSAGVMLYQMIYKKFPWEIQQIETHQKLIDVIKNTTNIHFSNKVSISEDTKDLIKNMLEVEEANRFEWEEIINMNIIKESQKEEYKSQIIQMTKKQK